jgi:hypothetical protein
VTYDESWTGYYSHLPLGQIGSQLRRLDVHPPLDYYVRHLFGTTGSTFALRLPSAAFATATLLLVAWWMWRRGWFGVLVVAFTSLSYFELLYSHIARMYALAALLGTVIAIASESWLRDGRGRWRWIMGVALLVGLFDSESFLLLAGGAFLVAGVRRDREAWWWRLTAVGALGGWALLWGTAFLDQHKVGHVPVPLTSPSSMVDTLNGLVTDYAAFGVLAVLALGFGAWCLWSSDRRLASVAAALLGAPFAAACVIGLRQHILFSRIVAGSIWAVPVLLAALVDGARRRSERLGLVAAALVGVLVLTSVWPGIHVPDGSAPGLDVLRRAARPGDAIAVYPDYLWTLAAWELDAPAHPHVEPALRDLHAYVFTVGGKPWDGRVWVYSPTFYRSSVPGWAHCPSPEPDGGVYAVQCYQQP